ncbi:MAG: inositol phosphorylceramide synthase, partial [Actinomycetia bacterium]|nr:inositol phosphorylceramide synthase [Actinomycetes bacterium]
VYYPLRNALLVSGAIGLILFAVFPVAPPRFLPDYVGTVDEAARTHYIDIPGSWRNRFAAFPSFHVGWNAVACLALASLFGRWWVKAVALVPAALVGIAVITTANHYVVDVVAGLTISVVAFQYFLRRDSLGRSLLGGTTPTPEVKGRSPSHCVHHDEEGDTGGQPGEVVRGPVGSEPDRIDDQDDPQDADDQPTPSSPPPGENGQGEG